MTVRRPPRPAPLLAPLMVLALALVAWPVPPARGAELHDRQMGVIAQLDLLDRRLARLTEEQARLAGQLDQLHREQAEAAVRGRTLEARFAGTKSRLTQRLKALIGFGQIGFARTALAAPNLTEAVFGWQILTRMVQFDIQLLDDYNELKTELDRDRRDRDQRLAAIEDLTARAKAARGELADQRQARARLLVNLERNPENYRIALGELDRAAERLGRELSDLEKQTALGRKQGDFAALKGRLPRPLKGRIGRMPGQGQKGLLIIAPEGTAVTASAAGTVVHAGWIAGYGQVVIVDQGDRYYTLYGRLIRLGVRAGQKIETGQVVGRIGRVGLHQPGLYFEIRRRKEALDPAEWLAGGN